MSSDTLDKLEAVARAATPDERHEAAVAAFPGGLTPKQFELLALHSATADPDGKVDFPSLANWWAATSLLMRMYLNGWIERRGTGRMYDRTGPYYITEAGLTALRAALEELEGKK